VKFDIFYTDNWSLVLDLNILARTVLILVNRNAY
jgi:lipopolysaccharide/colanic/teichoic acid biosynthesis glycosyltransferase